MSGSQPRVRARSDLRPRDPRTRELINHTHPAVFITADFDLGDHEAASRLLEQAYADVVAQIRSTRKDTP